MGTIEQILKICDGVDVKQTVNNAYNAREKYSYEFFKVGEIKLPDRDIFIEITATSTRGTIAKVVGIEVETYSERYPDIDSYSNNNEIVTYDCRLTYAVAGRKKTGRIKDEYTKFLSGKHTTKYVRDVQTHEKVEVKNPVNKYMQEMQKGDWVIGTRPGKRLGIGRITRWTNHNVWAVTGDNLTDKSKEFRFDSIKETFTMPDDEHVKLLTMAVLRGWHGE